VTLDAAPRDAVAPAVEAPPVEAGAAAGKGTALIVDDEADVAEVLAAIAARAGYEVEVAANGREAVERLGLRDYDVILSDLRMPQMDGPALFEWIGREKPHLALRIGFVTGDTHSDLAARFVETCGRPVLEKPFSGARVRALLETLARSE
jgi:CheY-like chemotaxis protein